ncbi:MAG: Cyclic phosphodiesterase-like protein [Pseudonocardiales bacterium]|jgi:hypothetical protein|nr:Cyclic phosphodiesterase-like protein [Pseudonocardiales bacterium]
MQSFQDRIWSPPGSRPHLLLLGDEALAAYAAELNGWIRSWWEQHGDDRTWHEIVEEIPAHYLHLTLTWVDQLTAQVGPQAWNRLREEFAARMAEVEPVRVSIGEPMVRSVALELYVHPSPELQDLATRARASVRAVFGDAAAPEPTEQRPYRPHVSTLYSRAAFNTDGLQHALLKDFGLAVGEHSTVFTMNPAAILCDQDTFAAGGFRWDQDSAVVIPVGS